MSYCLYQVQMSNAWAQRINKENATAEKFWSDQAMKASGAINTSGTQLQAQAGSIAERGRAGSIAPSSAAPTGYSSKSSFLKDRLDKLEQELQHEKIYRLKVEEELSLLRSNSGSKPGTPK